MSTNTKTNIDSELPNKSESQPQPQSQPQLPSAPQQLNCFQRQWRNRPQADSVSAATWIFIAGGMKLSWSIGFTQTILSTTHMRMAWFIGSIIGVFLGAIVNNIVKSKRKYLYLISALLILLDGVICVFLSSKRAGVVAAQYIDGIAVGLIFVPTFVVLGEESVPRMRGKYAVSTELMSFYLGATLNIIYSQTRYDVLLMQGCTNAILAILAAFLALTRYIESPIYYLQLGDSEKAMESLRKLQNPKVVTNETYDRLHEMGEYVTINQELSTTNSGRQAFPSLLIFIFYRVLIAMSFCTATVNAMLYSSAMSVYEHVWPYMLMAYGIALLIGSVIGTMSVDRLGRRMPTLIGVLVCALLSIAVGILFDKLINLITYKKMYTAMIIIIIYQFFVGLYASASSAYLSESFPMAIKPYYIAITYAMQMLVYIIIISVWSINISDFYYTLSAFSWILVIAVIFVIPETKRTTLLQAQNKCSATEIF